MCVAGSVYPAKDLSGPITGAKDMFCAQLKVYRDSDSGSGLLHSLVCVNMSNGLPVKIFKIRKIKLMTKNVFICTKHREDKGVRLTQDLVLEATFLELSH